MRTRRTIAGLLGLMSGKLLRSQREILAAATSGRPVRIQTVNLHHLFLAKGDQRFVDAIESADFVTADGWPVAWAMSRRSQRVARVTGADLIRDLLSLGSDGNVPMPTVALFGASEPVGTRFATLLADCSITVAVRDHGVASEWNVADLAAAANLAGCNLALIAVTPPRGDLVARDLIDAGFRGTVIAVGGAIDMAVGDKRRAGRVLQRSGLEWAFRLIQEPRRLWVRYFVQCLPVLIRDLIPYRMSGAALVVNPALAAPTGALGNVGDR